MRPSDIRELSPAEFDVRLREVEEELFGLQLKRATSQLENAMKVRQTRRDLARFKTIQRERARQG